MAAGVLALGWAQGAMACNSGASVSFSPQSPNVSWSPFPNGSQQTATITVTVSKGSNNNSAATARVLILDTDTATPLRVGSLNGFPGPIYSMMGSIVSQVVNSSTPTTANSVVVNFQGSTGTATTTLTIAVNSAVEDFVSGSYSQATSYFVQCYNNGGNSMGAGVTGTGPTLNVSVPNLLQVVTAGPQTIDFGSFTSIAQSLAISLKSTGAINASVSTQNGNQMILTGAQSPVPANSTIPYNMTFDGQTVPAAGISLNNLSRAGVGGGNKSLVLTLPALPSGKLAGTYKDVITLTLSPGT
ncbi:hypothetical protein [Sphingobium sp.]|uniref:hypothetical protein n=1 Tax=Sphingobium sp. TaxID=1912891 RepID=UPI0035C6EB76